MDSYKSRWEIESELGQGGQGKVYRVLDTTKVLPKEQLRKRLEAAFREFGSSVSFAETGPQKFEEFCVSLKETLSREKTPHRGALKVLHNSADARDPHLADERLNREITAMQSVKHPNLVEILDSKPADRWYVSRYYSGGVLIDHLDRFKGNVVGALQAFRGLVAGVAELHKGKMVHRDIKPQNIFIANRGDLVLGDFGLVFFEDDQHTRLSATLENVGTRDWMPPWAMGMRIEDIRSTFDVFSLGKVLWALISGKKVLQLWYFDRPQFDVEKLFPDAPHIGLVRSIFEKCIVQDENDCLQSADQLLVEVDRVISQIQRGGTRLGDNIVRHCGVCGVGQYELKIKGGERAITLLRNFGLTPAGTQSFKVFTCSHCGHVQLFARDTYQEMAAWSNSTDHL